MMKNKNRKNIIELILCLLLTGSLISCSNLFANAGNKNSTENLPYGYGKISGSVWPDGAIPQTVYDSICRMADSSRSAFPSFPETSSMTLTIKAKPDYGQGEIRPESMPDEVTVPGTDINLLETPWAYAISLQYGKWKIYAELKITGQSTPCMKFTSDQIIISENNPLASCNIDLHSSQSIETTGAVNLKFHIDTNKITGVKCYIDDGPYTGQIEDIDSNIFSFDQNGSSCFSSGVHKFKFEFYSHLNAYDELVYEITESVNIFDGIETNTWVSNGPCEYFKTVQGVTECHITDECLKNFAQKHIYVSDVLNANDSNSGSMFEPLRTLDAAIQKVNNSIIDTDYVIHLRKRYDVEVSEYSVNSDTSSVDIKKNLTIIGEGDNKNQIVIKNADSNPDESMFNIVPALNRKVTFQNLTIDGESKTYNVSAGLKAACINYYNTTSTYKLNLIFDNVKLTGFIKKTSHNQPNGTALTAFNRTASVQGKDIITFKNGCVVQNCCYLSNDGIEQDVSGGAVYIGTDIKLVLNGCSFINNSIQGKIKGTSIAGGAVCLDSNAQCEIKNAVFESNFIKVDSDGVQSSNYGGALAIKSNDASCIITRGVFSGNYIYCDSTSQSCYGGAISSIGVLTLGSDERTNNDRPAPNVFVGCCNNYDGKKYEGPNYIKSKSSAQGGGVYVSGNETSQTEFTICKDVCIGYYNANKYADYNDSIYNAGNYIYVSENNLTPKGGGLYVEKCKTIFYGGYINYNLIASNAQNVQMQGGGCYCSYPFGSNKNLNYDDCFAINHLDVLYNTLKSTNSQNDNCSGSGMYLELENSFANPSYYAMINDVGFQNNHIAVTDSNKAMGALYLKGRNSIFRLTQMAFSNRTPKMCFSNNYVNSTEISEDVGLKFENMGGTQYCPKVELGTTYGNISADGTIAKFVCEGDLGTDGNSVVLKNQDDTYDKVKTYYYRFKWRFVNGRSCEIDEEGKFHQNAYISSSGNATGSGNIDNPSNDITLINSLPANCIVYLDGEFTTSASLQPHNGVKIIGSDGTTIKATGKLDDNSIIFLNSVNGFSMTGVDIEGGNNIGLSANNTSDIYISNCKISNCNYETMGGGCYIQNNSVLHLDGVTITDCQSKLMAAGVYAKESSVYLKDTTITKTCKTTLTNPSNYADIGGLQGISSTIYFEGKIIIERENPEDKTKCGGAGGFSTRDGYGKSYIKLTNKLSPGSHIYISFASGETPVSNVISLDSNAPEDCILTDYCTSNYFTLTDGYTLSPNGNITKN